MQSTIKLFSVLLLCTGIFSCKKTELQPEQKWQPEDFRIDKLSRSFVQAGESLTLYGNKLSQADSRTEVYLNGRPAEIIKATADSVQVLVPTNAQTGKLMLTISRGKDFKTMYGPEVEVKPTPVIKGFFPIYAVRGETIEMYTEHFSNNNADNEIMLGSKLVEIVSRRQDTLVVKIPADAADGVFSWNTFDGPLFTLNKGFRIRESNYAVNTVQGWLQADPAFSFVDTLVRGYKQIVPDPYYHRMYDSAMKYIGNADRSYTIFFPSDNYFYNAQVSKEAFINKIKARPFDYNTFMVAAIVAGHQLDLSTVNNGDTFNTIYTMKMQWWPDGTDDANFIRIIIEDGVKYAQIEGMWGENKPRVKILKEHKVGNATLIELERELGWVTF